MSTLNTRLSIARATRGEDAADDFHEHDEDDQIPSSSEIIMDSGKCLAPEDDVRELLNSSRRQFNILAKRGPSLETCVHAGIF